MVLGSDKVHLSSHGGDKACHAVYMTCGNIRKSLRTKLGTGCWLMVAQIPVAKFKEKDLNGILSARLQHKCFDILTEDLKACSHVPQMFPDPMGDLRLTRTLLISHIADLVDQRAIACVSDSQSCHSLASFKDFGDPKPKAIRTATHTLKALAKLIRDFDPLDIPMFKKEAKERGYNGVYEPYWRDWRFADPFTFLSMDVLHGIKKFAGDHPIKWARKLLGDPEIDKRFSALQKIVGRKHFFEGFTRLKQKTCSEYTDILRALLPVIQDAPKVNSGIVKALRGFLDFAYAAQYDSHTPETLAYMNSGWQQFHRYKDALSAAGVRKTKCAHTNGKFLIPKGEAFHHYREKIRRTGSVMQFTTEQTEALHRIHATGPYSRTNKRGYECQMVDYSMRQAKVDLIGHVVTWRKIMSNGNALQDILRLHSPAHAVDSPDSSRPTEEQEKAIRDRKKELTLEYASTFLPKPTKNYFLQPDAMKNLTTAFTLTIKPHWQKLTVDEGAVLHGLPDFRTNLVKFLNPPQGSNRQQLPVEFTYIDTWKYVRLQLKKVQDPSIVLPPQTVMAAPSSVDNPHGSCNFVLVKDRGSFRYQNIESE